MRKNFNYILNIVIICLSITLIISAYLHKGQLNLDNDSYTTSILIDIEMISIMLLLLLNLVNFILLFIKALQRKWKALFINLAVLVLSVVILVVSMVIDLPLLYLT